MIKKWLIPTLLLAVVFAGVAVDLRYVLDLQWQLTFYPHFLRDLLAATAVMATSDGSLHGLLALVFRQRYLRHYCDLVEFFRRQSIAEIFAGGILAGAEELLFRGVLLQSLLTKAQWPPIAAILVTGLIFGLCHLIPSRRLLPFTIWAIWEGIVLSSIYVLTGSLLLNVILHALHDIVGFSLFAYQRRTG